ncbi:MAG TPA: undecaprenyl/decaprenyl-phosphate alpha-N-acetylglucosaminyl 1-phosphate transferase [Firmicutes bacterium]|jgi:UDP-GlcNAc:undecaprenyl-phosphate GlcNAc-1-phosphate transferase|nr:undecaprenyl/decaprenyl-phosphate alpha-N-acetylglucosaminyl 1-phosphate transferase [Bacillota bacterium]
MLEFLAPALAFGLAFFLTPCFKRLACRIGAMDQPNSRKIHRQAMPLLGGAAIYVSFWVSAGAVLYFFDGGSWFWGLFWGSSLIFALGLYDDLRGLSYKAKFAGQFAAALILLAYNIRIEFISLPYQEIIFLGIFIIPLTLLWVVGITNAVNLIDGIDGLATGVSVIAAVVIFALTWDEFHLVPVLALILAGAALGFLPHNFSPASIFLGDAGSLFLGFMLSGFAIMGLTKQATLTTLVIPVLVFGLPITDTFYAMWRRFRNNKPIFQADNGHIHHRLLNVGLTTRQTVMVLYTCSIYFGAAAILFHYFSGIGSYLFLVIFALFLLGVKHLDNLSSILTAVNGSHYSGKAEKQHKDYNQGL